VLSAPALPRRRLSSRYHPTTWLLAHVRALWIDRELAQGVAPWRSPAHAARALQLTTGRRRRGLAAGLERLVEHAEQPASRFRHSGAVPPCREQVREALPVILAITSRLRDGAPLDARGVARLKDVITDGAGPCYKRSHRDALNDAAGLRVAERARLTRRQWCASSPAIARAFRSLHMTGSVDRGG
jgi:hypothetical protein